MAALSSTTAPNPTFTADTPGTYTVALTVTDSHGAVSQPATVTITATAVNHPPVANAGPDQTGVKRHTLVTLDGSNSADPDNDPLTYAWAFTSRPNGSQATLIDDTTVHPFFITDKPGDYVIELTVSDGHTNSSSTVTISDDNQLPVAAAGPAQTVHVGTLVTLDGSGSFDNDTDPLTYAWTLTSTRPADSTATLSGSTTVHPTFTPDKPGDYVIQLIVNDTYGNSDPATVTITADAVNHPPVANAGSAQTVHVGTLVTLDGSNSADPDNDTLVYAWIRRRQQGAWPRAPPPHRTPRSPLIRPAPTPLPSTVTDSHGAVSQPATVTITATAVNHPPVANAGPDQTGVKRHTLVTLDGSNSADPDNDPDLRVGVHVTTERQPGDPDRRHVGSSVLHHRQTG